MDTVGQTLKAKRLERGLSYNDITRQTHIKPHYLEAIEDMDPTTLPPLGYALGYVKTYAKYVGLSPDYMVGQYKDGIKAPEFFEMRTRTIFAPKQKIRLPRGFVSAMMVMLLAVSLAGWYNRQGPMQSFAEVQLNQGPVTGSDLAAIQTLSSDPKILTLKATAPTWLRIHDRAQNIHFSRILTSGEIWQTRHISDIYVSVRDSGALEFYKGNRFICNLGSKGQPKMNVKLSGYLKPVSNASIASTDLTQIVTTLQ